MLQSVAYPLDLKIFSLKKEAQVEMHFPFWKILMGNNVI